MFPQFVTRSRLYPDPSVGRTPALDRTRGLCRKFSRHRGFDHCGTEQQRQKTTVAVDDAAVSCSTSPAGPCPAPGNSRRCGPSPMIFALRPGSIRCFTPACSRRNSLLPRKQICHQPAAILPHQIGLVSHLRHEALMCFGKIVERVMQPSHWNGSNLETSR
jgi:hypothetical protein